MIIPRKVTPHEKANACIRARTPRFTRLLANTFPYSESYERYQEYYLRALKAGLEQRGGRVIESTGPIRSSLLRKLRLLRRSYRLRRFLSGHILPRMIDSLARILLGNRNSEPSKADSLYVASPEDGPGCRFCIDSSDAADIAAELASNCDLYFKTNFWPARPYPRNVRALPNLNPLVGRNLNLFYELRNAPKTRDLFAFFRVWGGRDELEGIEHNLMLFERLSQVHCNSYLKAYLVAGDIEQQAARLDRIGIQWTTEAMKPLELWRMAAGSRLNLVRLGMHQCMPWRMVDILAMGGVPVLDYSPKTRWPKPLAEGLHYLNLGLVPGKEAEAEPPAKIIEAWLADKALLASIESNTARYFDEYLAPEALGKSILAELESQYELRNPPVTHRGAVN